MSNSFDQELEDRLMRYAAIDSQSDEARLVAVAVKMANPSSNRERSNCSQLAQGATCLTQEISITQMAGLLSDSQIMRKKRCRSAELPGKAGADAVLLFTMD